MFRYTLIVVAALILLAPVPLWCGDDGGPGVPVVRELVPPTASPGAVVVANGEFLDRIHVAEVYLNRGTEDVKVQVIAHSKNSLKFKVPANLETGRYGLTILTAAKVPMLLDQPVWLMVKAETETSAAK